MPKEGEIVLNPEDDKAGVGAPLEPPLLLHLDLSDGIETYKRLGSLPVPTQDTHADYEEQSHGGKRI